jgi:hypothetical protein
MRATAGHVRRPTTARSRTVTDVQAEPCSRHGDANDANRGVSGDEGERASGEQGPNPAQRVGMRARVSRAPRPTTRQLKTHLPHGGRDERKARRGSEQARNAARGRQRRPLMRRHRRGGRGRLRPTRNPLPDTTAQGSRGIAGTERASARRRGALRERFRKRKKEARREEVSGQGGLERGRQYSHRAARGGASRRPFNLVARRALQAIARAALIRSARASSVSCCAGDMVSTSSRAWLVAGPRPSSQHGASSGENVGMAVVWLRLSSPKT